jgi:glutathione S-transferase
MALSPPRRTQTMKLYSGDLSPYSARVRMQIYAKGLDIALERPPGFPTEFHKTSPLARIPVLDLGDGLIPESDVIAEYLEETFPTPSLLGADARETARVRTVARIGDIYLMNNMFLCLPQQRRATRNDGVRDLLTGQVARGIRALDHYLEGGGYAVLGRLTLADCALLPALWMVDTLIGSFDVDNPIPAAPKVAAYWAALQTNEHAARVLVELNRGLAERRAQMAAAAG